MSRENPEPWIPEDRPRAILALGKLLEECGELSKIAGRCLIQGIEGVDPESNIPNRASLEEEAADVIACIDRVIYLFDLDDFAINNRARSKLIYHARAAEHLKPYSTNV